MYIPMLPPIDKKETIRRVKRKLREYPRWREIACDVPDQKVTQTFTFEPRGGNGPSRPVENIAIRRVDAMAELEEIEQAVSRLLKPAYRYILFAKYLQNEPELDFVIYTQLGFEKTTYYELLDNALLAFAEQYRDGALVSEKNGVLAEF